MPEKIRLAVIGLGKIALDQHLPAIAKSDRFELVAGVDPINSSSGLTTFSSIEALSASDLDVEAVAICTPPQVREEVAQAALKAGYHVMLEKPPASNVSAVARLVHACRPGRALYTAWHSRENIMVDKAKAWLAGRQVKAGTICWREDVWKWHPGQQWLWEPGGLGVFDPAINAFSILTAILDTPISIAAAFLDVPVNQHAPVAARMRLHCGEGTIDVDLDFTERSGERWEIALETVDGARIKLARGGRSLELDDLPIGLAPDHEYDRIYERFAHLIQCASHDVDDRPLRLVADAFLTARFNAAPPLDPHVPPATMNLVQMGQGS